VSPSYTISPGDIGSRLTLVVTATGRGGSGSATALATVAVAPAPVPAPTVGSSIAEPGQAGAVTTDDGSATITWQPGAVPYGATVTLQRSASRLALPGTAVTLRVSTGPLPWPVDVQFAAAPGNAVPAVLPGAGVWRPVPPLTASRLAVGEEAGSYREPDGTLHLLTVSPTRIALFGPGKWGDPRLVSTGPPTVRAAERLRQTLLPDHRLLIHGRLALGSQAHLYVRVSAAGGAKVLLIRRGSRLDAWLSGSAAKTLETVELRPAPFAVRVLVAARQLPAGKRYALHVIAVDPYGRRARLTSWFSAPR
jgi:hypothetical protein